MKQTLSSIAIVLAALLAGACSDGGAPADAAAPAATVAEGGVVTDQIVEASCAMCQFDVEGESDCRTAVRINGAVYLATGSGVPDAEDHATGLCDGVRKARVSGKIAGKEFVATSFVLLPPS